MFQIKVDPLIKSANQYLGLRFLVSSSHSKQVVDTNICSFINKPASPYFILSAAQSHSFLCARQGRSGLKCQLRPCPIGRDHVRRGSARDKLPRAN